MSNLGMRVKESKILFLVFLMSLGITGAYALSFNVEVAAKPDVDSFMLEYANNSVTMQEINLTAENAGSVGCKYRLKGVFHYKNRTETRFSQPSDLYPSGNDKVELRFLAFNHTGPVKTQVYSYFCEREQFLRNITYYQTYVNYSENEISSKTLEGNSDRVKVKLPLKSGVILPKNAPSFWKTPSAEIDDHIAVIDYDPPLYSDDEKMNYTVLGSGGRVLGYTQISVKGKETIIDSLKSQKDEFLLLVLLISVGINLGLIYDRRLNSGT